MVEPAGSTRVRLINTCALTRTKAKPLGVIAAEALLSLKTANNRNLTHRRPRIRARL
jgi:hypothetical protein